MAYFLVYYLLLMRKWGVGASAFTDFVKELKNVNFILQIDRRGKNDMVAYDDGNKELLEYIKKFGFKENYGSFSDISIIAPIMK